MPWCYGYICRLDQICTFLNTPLILEGDSEVDLESAFLNARGMVEKVAADVKQYGGTLGTVYETEESLGPISILYFHRYECETQGEAMTSLEKDLESRSVKRPPYDDLGRRLGYLEGKAPQWYMCAEEPRSSLVHPRNFSVVELPQEKEHLQCVPEESEHSSSPDTGASSVSFNTAL